MKRTKIIVKNRKAQYMIIGTILSGCLLLIFGLCMYSSPIINYTDSNGDIFLGLRNFYTRELVSPADIESNNLEIWHQLKWLPFLGFNSGGDSLVFLPTKATVIWIPIILGSVCIVIMSMRMIAHSIGYKAVNKKGVARIVKPIRSYQLTLSLSWIFLTLILFFGLISLLTTFPFSAGAFVTLDFKGNIVIDAGDVNIFYKDVDSFLSSTGIYNEFYWLSMLLFSNNAGNELNFIGSIIEEGSIWALMGWLVLPLVPLFLFFINNLIGTICGACSWGSINAVVLSTLDKGQIKHAYEQPIVSQATNITKEITPTNSISITTELAPTKIDLELEAKCLKFYETLSEMLQRADTTYSPFFKLANDKINLYHNNTKKIDWRNEAREVERVIEDITQKDIKFIMLLEKMVKNPRIEIFGSDKFELMTLIQSYNLAYSNWDIQELENIIEKVYLIAFNYEEFYGKVGYCIRTKLLNNYKLFIDKTSLLSQLEEAKESEDYQTYREVCLEAIQEISSNKVNFLGLINKYIHN